MALLNRFLKSIISQRNHLIKSKIICIEKTFTITTIDSMEKGITSMNAVELELRFVGKKA